MKSYRVEAIPRKHCPVQAPGIDLSALDVEVVFVQPDTSCMGEQHEELHELFLRQRRGEIYVFHRLLLLL